MFDVHRCHQRLCTMLLQKFDHFMIFIIYSICKRSASPLIFGVNFGAFIK
uniref:Ankyrin protein kinase n=1 Tax=Rhizophora mucronata TaxID=61149 RepID=A0A2P2JBT9_RHIMU